jgi:hypothetical protein
MFTYQLRYNTKQVVRVGVFLAKQRKLTDPLTPIVGAQLSQFYWRYVVKANGGVVDVVNRLWKDIPSCSGLYYLTLTAWNTNQLGPLVLYIHDQDLLNEPILMHFEVIDKNVYDSKYGNELLKVETEPRGE